MGGDDDPYDKMQYAPLPVKTNVANTGSLTFKPDKNEMSSDMPFNLVGTISVEEAGSRCVLLRALINDNKAW